MEKITREDFEIAAEEVKELVVEEKFKYVGYEQFYSQSLLEEVKIAHERPIEMQKEVASQVKLYLDFQITKDMKENGRLGESTRRWIQLYNDILSDLQKNMYGEKSIHMHVGKITHAHIASAIRKAKGEVVDA